MSPVEIPAAVLVLRYPDQGTDYVVLTRRTEEVLHHKGQICFPGGAFDLSDGGLWETALREAEEEIGLDPALVRFEKELSPHLTPTGFRVTPFLGSLPGPFPWRPNPHETAEVLVVPLPHLRDPAHFSLERKVWNGIAYLDPNFRFGTHTIWGLTGRVLCEVLGIEIGPPRQA